MLQRAASSAYSWWWASHIRTKQSKWLEQSMQDMEDKVEFALSLVSEDGDSFARRAEMYYKNRPELINFIEEAFRCFRAVAERYDSLSTDLQKANTTIATCLPEQIQFAMDDDDDFLASKHPKFSSGPAADPSKVPKAPARPMKGMMHAATKKLEPKKSSIPPRRIKPKSGLSKSEAVEEIDKLQKDILSLQTMKEYVKSSYESGISKFFALENDIMEKQDKVSRLQDEFSVSTMIDDNDARTLMAGAAIDSCKETLVDLQNKQEKSAEEAGVENEKLEDVRQRLESIKHELLPDQADNVQRADQNSNHGVEEFQSLKQEIIGPERKKLEALREKIKEQLREGSSGPLTVSELADKIDDLVNLVINLESAVLAQNVLIERLRKEAGDLQSQIQRLEENKGSLMETHELQSRVKELEGKLYSVQNLYMSIIIQNNDLKAQFVEAHSSLNDLSEKLPSVEPDEEEEEEDALTEERPEKALIQQEKEKGGDEALLKQGKGEGGGKALIKQDKEEGGGQAFIEQDKGKGGGEALIEQGTDKGGGEVSIEQDKRESGGQASIEQDKKGGGQALIEQEKREGGGQALIEQGTDKGGGEILIEQEKRESGGQALIEQGTDKGGGEILIEQEKRESGGQALIEQDKGESCSKALIEHDKGEGDSKALEEQEKGEGGGQALIEQDKRKSGDEVLILQDKGEGGVGVLVEQDKGESGGEALIKQDKVKGGGEVLIEQDKREVGGEALIEEVKGGGGKALIEQDKGEGGSEALIKQDKEEGGVAALVKHKAGGVVALIKQDKGEGGAEALVEQDKGDSDGESLVKQDKEKGGVAALVEQDKVESGGKALVEHVKRKGGGEALVEQDKEKGGGEALIEQDKGKCGGEALTEHNKEEGGGEALRTQDRGKDGHEVLTEQDKGEGGGGGGCDNKLKSNTSGEEKSDEIEENLKASSTNSNNLSSRKEVATLQNQKEDCNSAPKSDTSGTERKENKHITTISELLDATLQAEGTESDVKSQAIRVSEQEDNDEELPSIPGRCVCSQRKELEKFEEELNWQQMLLHGVEDKERILLAEYVAILRNYKEVKKKLSDEEKKNETLFETVLQLRNTRNALSRKDQEIQSLRHKLSLLRQESGDIPGGKDSTEDETLGMHPTEEDREEIKFLINQPKTLSPIEEKLRGQIDAVLEENLDFWLRFSNSFHQVQKFKTEVHDLQDEIVQAKKKNELKQDGRSQGSISTDLKAEVRAIYKHLGEKKAELRVWLEQSQLLKDELQHRISSISDIQEAITNALKEGVESDEITFSTHQAAKFHGEILNMKQENNKVNEELLAGIDHVTALQIEIEKTLAKINAEFKLTERKSSSRSYSISKIPLRSFLFGIKAKKHRHSIFSYMHHSRSTK